jgi:mannose-6-phosphate isomerase
MSALYPLVFHPRLKERVWGGRALETLYAKPLPPQVPIGESWEVADRPGDESVIANGSLAGRTLRWLMEQHADDLLGAATAAVGNRFPLLCKILDARDTLSLQVHPRTPERGEPKTEMWYIAHAQPGAMLYVGLKRGVTRERFEQELLRGSVAECFHRIPVRAGETMFLPSGRVHAIGAGLVIFEIQQNSDTTFRVFDWNRLGLDGQPRELHVEESLASIDFDDVEPPLVRGDTRSSGQFDIQRLVDDPLFTVDLVRARADDVMILRPSRLRVIAAVEGEDTVIGGGESVTMTPGRFCVVPAGLRKSTVAATAGSTFLLVEPG